MIDIEVREGDGEVTVQFRRTGGDISVASRIMASTVVSTGNYMYYQSYEIKSMSKDIVLLA